jgi:hypothetical protein
MYASLFAVLELHLTSLFSGKDFPFDRYRFRVATLERPKQDMIDLMYANNYVYVAAAHKWGDECLFVHKDDVNSLNLKAIEDVGWITGDTKTIKRNGDGVPIALLK